MRMVRVDFAGVEWRSRADEDVLATFVGCGVEVTCMAYMFRVPGTLNRLCLLPQSNDSCVHVEATNHRIRCS